MVRQWCPEIIGCFLPAVTPEAALLSEAIQHGLEGDRLLDVGCGTGLSFLPMLDRGWKVTACDISPAMIEIARSKVGGDASLLVADMRDLPALGHFDLAWAVNDAANYLMTRAELRQALASMKRNLGARGFLMFDLNTLVTFRTAFCETHVRVVDGRRFVWRGLATREAVAPGSTCEIRLEAEGLPVDHRHRQRHFSEREVLEAIADVGLHCIAVKGETDGVLEQELDEDFHTKAVYLCASLPSSR